MKNKLLIALLSWLSLGLVSTAVAQTTGFKLGSSPGTKEANAILDLGQGNRGLLLPRVALTSTTATTPLTGTVSAGMVVYNTATAGDVTPGFYFYNGTIWERVGSSSGENIYNANGTLTGARVVTQGANSLTLSGTGTFNKFSGLLSASSFFNIGRNTNEMDLGIGGGANEGFGGSVAGDGWIKTLGTGTMRVGTFGVAPLALMTNNQQRMSISSAGIVQINNLSGTGSRMVVADASGILSTQAVPSNTDSQTLSLAGNTLSISGGNSVTLPTATNLYNTDGTLTGARIVTQGSNALTFSGTGQTIFNNGGIQFPGNSRYGVSRVYNSSTGDMYGMEQVDATQAGSTGPALRLFTANLASSYLSFGRYTNATTFSEFARFTPSGNFGIGIDAPTQRLHVSGGALISSLAGAGSRMVVADASGVLSTQAIPAGGGVNMYNADGTLTGARIVTQGSNNLTFSGTGIVNKRSGLNTIRSEMSFGRVANEFSIGVIASNNEIFDESVPGTAFLNSTNGPLFIGSSSNNTVRFFTNNTQRMLVNLDGTVGINTKSPAGQLEVVANYEVLDRGAMLITRYNSSGLVTAGQNGIQLRNANGTELDPLPIPNLKYLSTVDFQGYGNTGFRMGARIIAQARQAFSDTTAGTMLFFQTTAIGSINPVTRMSIDANGSISIANLAGSGSRMVVADANGSLNTQVIPQSIGQNVYNTDGILTGARTVTQSTNTMTFNGTGALRKFSGTGPALFSMGRTAEEMLMGVAGANADGFPMSTTGDGWIRTSLSTGNLLVGTAAATSLRLVTNNAERMTITSTGRVGIGTNAPQRDLHVVGDGGMRVDRLATAGPATMFLNQLGASNDLLGGFGMLGDTTSLRIGFALSSGGLASNAATLAYTRQGRLGIGALSPTHTLDVNGTARVRDLAGTGSRMVVADANGVLSSQALPTSGNLYTTDGTLTGGRTVTMGSNNLTFTGAGILQKLSGSSSDYAGINLGRLGQELEIGVASTTNQGLTGVAPGDAWFASNNNLFLGAKGSGIIRLVSNNTSRVELFPSGLLQVHSLAGTGTRLVVADAGGVLGTQLLPASIGQNIYNTDASLTGNRVVSLGTNTLSFRGGNDATSFLTVGTAGGNSGAFYLGNNSHGIQRGFPNIGTNNNVGFFTTGGNLYLSTLGRNDSLFVMNTNGFVGIGTKNPNAVLQINGGSATTQTANTPVDILTFGRPGTLNVSSGSQVALAVSKFSGGNNNSHTRLDFKLARLTETDMIQVMTLNSDGRVGIGTTSPGYTLHVNGSVAGTSAYVNLSDARLKTNVTTLTGALDKVMQLRGVTFNWNKASDSSKQLDDKNHIGFIAQEIEKVLPQVVSTADDAMKTKSVAYSDVVPVLVEAIKELKAENDRLKSQVSELDALKAEVSAIKALLTTPASTSTQKADK